MRLEQPSSINPGVNVVQIGVNFHDSSVMQSALEEAVEEALCLIVALFCYDMAGHVMGQERHGSIHLFLEKRPDLLPARRPRAADSGFIEHAVFREALGCLVPHPPVFIGRKSVYQIPNFLAINELLQFIIYANLQDQKTRRSGLAANSNKLELTHLLRGIEHAAQEPSGTHRETNTDPRPTATINRKPMSSPILLRLIQRFITQGSA
jgi:hypothetical protein